MNSLRSRLILSHLLPLLIVVPLAAFGLIYLIETQVLLVDLSESLIDQAELIASAADSRPRIWRDVETANVYLVDMTGRVQARITLLRPSGDVLASSDPDHATDLNGALEELVEVRTGQTIVRYRYTPWSTVQMADVWVPATDGDEQVVGIVRATQELAGVSARFSQLRRLVLGIVIAELLVGAIMGMVLALRLERPLRAVTEAVDEIAAGDPAGAFRPLPQQGPDEVRRLGGAVNRLADRLRFLEETRRRLLANVVHELGRPLGALRSAVHALRRGAGDDVALREELLAGMDAELGALQTLLDDLARLHGQVLEPAALERRPTPLGEWLGELLAPWREEAQSKGLRWETAIAEDMPTLVIDPERLAQAVGNLLSNAIKQTPSGGKVRVSAGRYESGAWITVADSGPGIQPEEQERIFEPFYRGAQRERFPQGLGLGLPIARELVVAHCGRLSVQSKVGEGSIFTISLPRAREQ